MTVAVVLTSSIAEVARSPLLRRAVVEAALVGALCGAVGVHVVLRRLPFFAIALSHATFPGVVLAAVFGLPLLFGAWAFAAVFVLATVLLGTVGEVEDTSAIGVVLAGSLGLGTLVASARSGFARDVTAFLVGSILTVGPLDVVLTAAVGLVAVGLLAACHKELVLRAFDAAGADALGYSRPVADLLLLGIVAAVLSTAVPAVGVVLTVALLVAPAVAARQWSDRMVPTMVLASMIGALSGVVGVVVSHALDIAAGASIVLVSLGFVALSLLVGPIGTLLRGVRIRPGSRHPGPVAPVG